MRLKILGSLILLAGGLSILTAPGAEEVCGACDKKIVVNGQFDHGTNREDLVIEGAPRRGEAAFREDIHGDNFSITVSDLEPGKYTAQFGFVETDFTNADQRLFDVACGDQTLATNLDIFKTAGAADKVYFLTTPIEHPGDAVRGPLTFTFTAHKSSARLNTLELKDESGDSIVFMRAANLMDAQDADMAQPPVVNGPELWKDPAQSVNVRTRDLVSRLSLAEKTTQMRNAAPAIPRLGVPAYDYWNECLHGVARAGVATVFPQAIGLAATWDVPLLQQTAAVIATEARAKHNEYVRTHNGNSARYHGLTFWTPNINIFRDPRWGRGQETYGEDPFLTARFGVAFIRGLQGDDPKYFKAMACAKHFAVHSGPESERHRFDVVPPERDLYETYLPQFEAAVREGHVGAVMGAYNRVDGQPACANPFLLTELLRKQWGFSGQVVSDCGAIYDIFANHKTVATPEEASASAVKAGCDLCCGTDYNSLARAVKRGLIAETEIDTAVGRLFEARFRLGMFDPTNMVSFAQIPPTQNNTPEHEALALRVARESMVLLKNDGVLPLDRTKIKRIAVIGTNADSPRLLLGNYNGQASNPVTILDGIRSVAGTNIQVVFEPGCPLALRKDGSGQAGIEWTTNALNAAWTADVVIYVGGINARLEGEEMKVDYDGFSGGDRTRIELPSPQTALLKALRVIGKPIVFVNCSGSATAMPWEAENLSAILQAWYPGEQGGRAVAEILFGDANPAGRLPVTFYRATEDLPAFDNYSMSNRTYRYFNGTPLFAFGHGLSYTRFDYRNAGLSKTAFNAKDTVKLSFTLANTGGRSGEEVAQVYFRHVKYVAAQPRLALCGFVRVPVPQGKSAKITLDIPMERFRYWDTAKNKYIVEPGDYELLVGAASDDIRSRLPFKVSQE